MKRAFVRLAAVLAGIVSFGILGTAVEAGTVVRFQLNYAPTGSVNYFDVELYDSLAPITAENFLKYVNGGLYNNSIFHRSIEDFVVQGGGYTPTTVGGQITGLAPITNFGMIQNEYSASRPNVAGTLAMAKLPNNVNGASSEWFVNVADNTTNLDNQNGGFTVFARVLGDGMNLVNAVNKLETFTVFSMADVPLNPAQTDFVRITSAAALNLSAFSGRAYIDANHDGVLDSGDTALPEAKITLTQAGGSTPLATTYTAKDGTYHFDNLAAGTYSVKMESASGTALDNGGSRLVVERDGTVVNQGVAGGLSANAYAAVTLGGSQRGVNFDFAQSSYPIGLMSARMLLNTAEPAVHTTAAPVLGISADSSLLGFGSVLVGSSASKSLAVTNRGDAGTTLSGTFGAATGVFGPNGTLGFGPLGVGQNASQQYTYFPTVRGATTQALTIASNGGQVEVTLSGRAVAPVQSVSSGTAHNAGQVRIGTTGTATVTITNVGDGNLSGAGDASNLKGTAAAVSSNNFSGVETAINLADNASLPISYAYTPTTHGANSATVNVQFTNGNTNGTNQLQTASATLSGTGVGPVFSSDKAVNSIIDFGSVSQDEEKTLALLISNTSSDSVGSNTALTDLTLLSYEILGTDSSLFSLTGFTAGSVIHQGGSLSLGILFNGTGGPGDKTAQLTLTTDEGVGLGASGGNTFTYNLAASIAAPAPEITPIPEPGTFMLLAAGALLLAGYAWRRRK